MSREAHVRIWERLGVQLPRATRQVYLKIDGRLVSLWRAVDAEGEVLDVLVQTRRNKRAALKLMRKLLKKYGFVPDKLVTDDLRPYGAAQRADRPRQEGDRRCHVAK
jgi:transposase-like protein